MKTKIDRKQMPASLMRESRKAALVGKYFDLFCASFDYQGISQAKFRKIMSALWLRGTLAAVLVKGGRETMAALGEEGSTSYLALCDYAPVRWDIDGFPKEITITAPSFNAPIGGVPANALMGQPTDISILPLGEVLEVGEDAVIGYALPSIRPICEYVEQVVNYIIDAEVAIRNNQIAMGLQTTISTTKDSMIRAQNLEQQIMNGDPVKVVSAKTLESISFPASGISDFTDGQYKLEMNYENELKTYLGIRNIGNVEKKERMINAEASSNNEETDTNADGIAKLIGEFCDACAAVLEADFSITRKKPAEKMDPQNDEDDEGGDEDAD